MLALEDKGNQKKITLQGIVYPFKLLVTEVTVVSKATEEAIVVDIEYPP